MYRFVSRPAAVLIALITFTACEEGRGSSADCDRLDGTLDADLDVTDCLAVAGTVDVYGALRLGPGAVVTVAEGGAIWVGDGGSLVADGTEADPVRFEGEVANPGSWSGLVFAGGSTQNRLTWTEVADAGGPAYFAAADASIAVGPEGLVAFDHVSVADGAARGLLLEDGGALAPGASLSVAGHAGALADLPATGLDLFAGSVDGGGNTTPHVEVRAGLVEVDLDVEALDVPRRLMGPIDVYGALAVAPGARFEVVPTGALWFAEEAAIRMEGTPEAPITFDAVAGSDSWLGVVVTSVDPTNRFASVVISGAGREPYFSPEPAGLAFLGGARGSVTDTAVRDSGATCAYLDDPAQVDLSANTWTGCDAALSIGVSALGAQDPTSEHASPVVVRGGRLDADVDVAALDAPYRVQAPIDAYGLFAVAAGAELQFERGAALWIAPEGGLRLNGTAAVPVVLRAASGVAGGWNGVVLESTDPENAITHAELREGGNEAYFCEAAANLCLEGGARLALTDSALSDSAAWGLYAADGARVTKTRVSYAGNTEDERLP
jgi:hypothetical protein